MTSELAAESIEETGDLQEADVVVVRGIGVVVVRGIGVEKAGRTL
jgi:hypothetical protein